jgi:hypothetical protein
MIRPDVADELAIPPGGASSELTAVGQRLDSVFTVTSFCQENDRDRARRRNPVSD